MTSYIAHHTKKKQILTRKEAALQRLIAASASATKLIAAVEQVRDARIRVYRTLGRSSDDGCQCPELVVGHILHGKSILQCQGCGPGG